MAKPGIQVDGARELRKALRKAERDDLKKRLKAANKDAAETVSDETKRNVAVRSGALKGSVRALGSQTKGQVAMGRGKSKLYAGIYHFGSKRRGIPARPVIFDALEEKGREIRTIYEAELRRLGKALSSK